MDRAGNRGQSRQPRCAARIRSARRVTDNRAPARHANPHSTGSADRNPDSPNRHPDTTDRYAGSDKHTNQDSDQHVHTSPNGDPYPGSSHAYADSDLDFNTHANRDLDCNAHADGDLYTLADGNPYTVTNFNRDTDTDEDIYSNRSDTHAVSVDNASARDSDTDPVHRLTGPHRHSDQQPNTDPDQHADRGDRDTGKRHVGR
jgi:hypothetical protein